MDLDTKMELDTGHEFRNDKIGCSSWIIDEKYARPVEIVFRKLM